MNSSRSIDMVQIRKFPAWLPLAVQLTIICLAAIFWIIAMAGLSASQDICNDLIGRNSNNTCYHAYRFDWFQLFFELFLLLGLCAAVILGTLDSFRSLFLSLFLILTVLIMGSADTAITQADASGKSENDALAAGWVLISLFNMGIVIYLSLDLEQLVKMWALKELLGKRQQGEELTYQAQKQFDVDAQDFSKVGGSSAAAPTYPIEQKVPQTNQKDEEENPKPASTSLQEGPFVSNTLQDVELTVTEDQEPPPQEVSPPKVEAQEPVQQNVEHVVAEEQHSAPQNIETTTVEDPTDKNTPSS